MITLAYNNSSTFKLSLKLSVTVLTDAIIDLCSLISISHFMCKFIQKTVMQTNLKIDFIVVEIPKQFH